MYKVIRKWEKQNDNPWPEIPAQRRDSYMTFFHEQNGFVRRDIYEVDNHVNIREYVFQTEPDAKKFYDIMTEENSKHPTVSAMQRTMKNEPGYQGVTETWDIKTE